jgi:hypothetical protein
MDRAGWGRLSRSHDSIEGNPMKHALLAASLVLIGGGAVACGGDDAGGAPTDASKTEFCEAYESLFADLGALGGAGGEAPPEDKMLESFKDWATTMEKVGTPAGIPDDARQGFELTIEEVEDLDADDLDQASLEDLNADLSDDEKAQGEAFTTYLNDTCGDPLEELMPSEPAS